MINRKMLKITHNMAEISVIIPVYNVEKYIKECLDSLIRQTFANIEIICVNDGSTDNSLLTLEEYAQKDSRIKVISQENLGVSEARNAGIKIAQGKYLSFIDPDDYVEDNMLHELYNRAEEENADIVECNLFEHRDTKIDSKKIRRLKIKCNLITKLRILLGKPYNCQDIKSDFFNIRAYSVNKLYKSELIKNKIWFYGRGGEDYYFCVEAFLTAQKSFI